MVAVLAASTERHGLQISRILIAQPPRPPACYIIFHVTCLALYGRSHRLGCVPSMKSNQSMRHYDPARPTDRNVPRRLGQKFREANGRCHR